MRETRADTAQAVLLAVGLHALLLVVLLLGMWLSDSSEQVSAAGSPISAELVDANALSQAMQDTLEDRPEPAVEPLPAAVVEPEAATPLPQPLPEPLPQDAPTPPQATPQEFLPDPDTENRDAVTDQPTPTPTDEREVREERRRQEQVDLTEQRRQQEAQRQRRLTEMERERQQQLADIRRQREAAAREAEQARRQLERIAQARARSAAEDAARSDAAASGPAGNNGVDTGLQARYAAALQQAILSKWTRPDTVPLGAACRLTIRQLPGGEVMSAEVSSPCAYDEQGRRSIEAAVLKAQPLPYAGFESVFQRTLTLNFRAEDR
ncbi:TonB C-terminal domain-containing protein [Lysobacter sp. A3-1-A15]|uniref:TonB C-terminal domain-containing protein n=1 Tax=Novilysobacter viscosus TaxID=3098602 RepID=UPI002ED77E5E